MNKDKTSLAPIVLFVYDRLNHLRKTIKALQKNELANESELFIYSDAANNINSQNKVNEVRNYIQNIKGFKKVTIFQRKKNLGLANSIIKGVTDIVNDFGKVIVLEDDLVTSKYFLRYMNDALNIYKKKKRVWEVGGYVYPIAYKHRKDFFFAPYTTSWGWATWSDRWKHFERNPKKLIDTFDNEKIKRFNIDDSENLWEQVIRNAKGELFSWAVFWYAVVFLNRGVTIYPKISMIKNIGHDGTGMNSKKSNFFETNIAQERLNISLEDIEINTDINLEVKNFLKKNKSFSRRFLNKFKRLFL